MWEDATQPSSGVHDLYTPGEMKGTERDAQRGGVPVVPLFMVRTESEAVCLPTVCGAPASTGALVQGVPEKPQVSRVVLIDLHRPLKCAQRLIVYFSLRLN